MERIPASRTHQGSDHVSRPRVVRARNMSERSTSEAFPPVYTANPGRTPVHTSYGRGASGEEARQGTRSARYRRRDDGYNKDDYEGGYRNKKSHPFVSATVIMLCVLGLAGIGIFMAPQLFGIIWHDLPNYAFVNGRFIQWDASKMDEYKSRRSYMTRDTIFPGVFVDNVHVGNMTLAQAKEALGNSGSASDSGFSLTVHIGSKNTVINNQSVPLERNVEQVLEKAYAYGRQNTADIAKTTATPFEQRLNAAEQLYRNYVYLNSDMSYDKSAVRSQIDELVNSINRDPINASVQTFDFTNRTFTFSDEAVGVYVDKEAVYQQVIAKLDAKEYGQDVVITPEVLTPKVTKVELMNSFKLISKYTTTTTSNSNRNTNVDLSAQAINGRTLMPGEVFSFNEATGQRTAAKGYKEAIAISGGQSVPDIGGGVCQTSGTLFNAVMRADLEIVSRSPHAWPSTYVEKGQDATVNWPNLDFKFRNNKDTPIFIISWYNDRKVTVEIYGMSLGNGVSIDLESKVVRTISPPNEVKYVQNTNLPMGTSKQTIEARTGYVVDTYKIWYRDGQEIKREKVYTSNYPSYQRTVEYN